MLTCSMMRFPPQLHAGGVGRQQHEISLTFTGPACLCGVSSPVVVLGLFVRLS